MLSPEAYEWLEWWAIYEYAYREWYLMEGVQGAD